MDLDKINLNRRAFRKKVRNNKVWTLEFGRINIDTLHAIHKRKEKRKLERQNRKNGRK